MNLRIYYLENDPHWSSRIAPDVNKVPSRNYLFSARPSGLVAVNDSVQEMGGGLVSNNVALPSDFSPTYFGLDVEFTLDPVDLPHLARNEMDLKITTVGAPAPPATIANQANGSAQLNASEGWMWDLDPTGTGWVPSGYAPGAPTPGVANTMQLRYWCNGKAWSVTGMCMNGGEPFTPGAQFQSLPMIETDWTAGLHPQLQTEAQGCPWFLRQEYSKVRVLAADFPIPYDTIKL